MSHGVGLVVSDVKFRAGGKLPGQKILVLSPQHGFNGNMDNVVRVLLHHGLVDSCKFRFEWCPQYHSSPANEL